MSQKWEYIVVNMSIVNGLCEFVTSDKNEITPRYKELLEMNEQEVLTFLGNRGWELVKIYQGKVWFENGSMTAKSLYFKRQKI